MKWYKVSLTKDQLANNQANKLVGEFQEIYSEEEEPEEMALFSWNDDTEGRTYYFSPGAVKYVLIILSFYSGSKCDAPSFEEVTLTLGARDAKERLLSRKT
ncbi:MAG: hypothetical protein ABGX83_01860 [Nitrospira sp.]|nr:hypothetical protein [Candidatus Manganitrophaceae bacterium]HIL34461.1 hypothetical protein [Candidatus Manganitrophaceae bacterium]